MSPPRAPELVSSVALDDPHAIRVAGRELLSLALIDCRNLLLVLLALDESPVALRRAAQVGWYQEYWIARHLQRQRGEDCDATGPRLAGLEPAIDEWLAPGSPPPAQALREYLAETLEVTLDLLGGSAEDDASLHFFRMSLLHEDRMGETFLQQLALGSMPARADRDALWMPAQRWSLGSPPGRGLVPVLERGAEAIQLPEFQIDAQPVNWARYVEFMADGGYDRAELWTAPGRQWLQAQGRRAPRTVEQWRGGVVVQRGTGALASLQRAAAGQPALHVNLHEAMAWCRWAGRRLPLEAEWELAAHRGGGRGFAWGDVFEWVAGPARLWEGQWSPPGWLPPGCLEVLPPPGSQAVLRGGSLATRKRWRHPKARRFAAPQRDDMCSGFRSCAW